MTSLDTVKERGSAEGRDSSEHSFVLTDIKVERPPSPKSGPNPSPFASSSLQRDVFEVEGSNSTQHLNSVPSPQSLKAAFGEYRSRLSGRPPYRSHDTPRSSMEQSRKSLGLRASSMATAESIPLGVDPGMFVADQTIGRNGSAKSNMRISLDLGPHRLQSLDKARVEGRLVRRRRRLPFSATVFLGFVAVYAALIASCTLGIAVYNLTKLKTGRAARTVEDLRNEIGPQISEILVALRAFIAGRQGGR